MLPAGFDEEVYGIVRQIPPGRVLTYGQLARLAGCPNHARRAGRAMAMAPPEAGLPCHRVVRSGGKLVPGWAGQRELLESEGAAFRPNGCVDLRRSQWEAVAETDYWAGDDR